VSSQEYLAYCYSLIDDCARLDFTWRDLFNGQAQRGLIAFNRSCWYSGKPFEPSLYIVHDSADQPIYLGKSRRIIGRLKDHVGHGDFCHEHDCTTPIGHYVKANSPSSHDWRITVLDLPAHLEEPAIWRFNPHFNDESKPVEPSLTPIPAPATPF
jgi:hypothetical protein